VEREEENGNGLLVLRRLRKEVETFNLKALGFEAEVS
jgi:hypothetical protein